MPPRRPGQEFPSDTPPSGGETTGSRLPIGIADEDYRTEVSYTPPWAIVGGYSSQRHTEYRRPIYYQGDELDPARYGVESIARLQQRMSQAGVLTSPFRLGYWDQPSQSAFKLLLEYANQNGMNHWSQAITAFQAMPEGEFDPTTGQWVPGGAQAGPPPLLTRTTDPDTLRQVFRNAVINTTGTGWDQDRIDTLVRAYQQLEVQRQREAYELEVSGQAGSVVDIPSPESFAVGEAERQDPDRVAAERGLGYINEFMDLVGRWAS